MAIKEQRNISLNRLDKDGMHSTGCETKVGTQVSHHKGCEDESEAGHPFTHWKKGNRGFLPWPYILS